MRAIVCADIYKKSICSVRKSRGVYKRLDNFLDIFLDLERKLSENYAKA